MRSQAASRLMVMWGVQLDGKDEYVSFFPFF